jgi:hypothetical protein
MIADIERSQGLFLLPNLFTNAIIVNQAVVAKGPDPSVSAAVREGNRNCGFPFLNSKNRVGAENTDSVMSLTLIEKLARFGLRYKIMSIVLQLLVNFNLCDLSAIGSPLIGGLSVGATGGAGGGILALVHRCRQIPQLIPRSILVHSSILASPDVVCWQYVSGLAASFGGGG